MTLTRVGAVAARTTVGAAVAALLLGGCSSGGSEVATDPATTGPAATSETDPSVDDAAGAVEHPTGADDVVLRIETGGGFRPVEYAQTQQPSLLLTGDGRLLLQPQGAGQTRLVPMQVADVGEDVVQTVLGLAADAGLLAPPADYTDLGDPQVADASTTTVALTAGGGTWVHEVYALGLDDESGPRAAVGDFVEAATAVVADVETQAYEPDELALFVQPTDLDREVVDWPAAAGGVVLADIEGCAVVPADGLVDVLSTTGLLASFRQAGALYSVSAAEVLPGDAPCA